MDIFQVLSIYLPNAFPDGIYIDCDSKYCPHFSRAALQAGRFFNIGRTIGHTFSEAQINPTCTWPQNGLTPNSVMRREAPTLFFATKRRELS